jgi:osmotically-inducible protein OsmY
MWSERHEKNERGVAGVLRIALALVALQVLPTMAGASDEGAGSAETRPAAQPATPEAATPAATPAAPPPGAPAATRTEAEPRREPAARKRAAASVAHSRGLRTDGSALARAAADAIAKDPTMVAPEELRLRISAKRGVVALAGTAGTIYDREQAARRAEGVPGATGIHPSITIKPGAKVEPRALEEAVVKAVQAANVAGPSFAAKASPDGTAQLAGEVTHEWSAVNAVKKVPGVTGIGGYAHRLPNHVPPPAEAQLTIVPPSPEQDALLQSKVAQALKDAGLDKVTATVEKGKVTLSGRLEGARAAISAARTATLVSGVLAVDNRISVPGRAFRVGEVREAGALEREVRRELRLLASRRGSGFRITGLNVVVTDGSVLITGRAISEDAAYAAVEAASSVYGVHEVVNALSYPTHFIGS